ncbi:hypothetical protein A2U01_0055089, partial [Trifolium medium]|nr:hypothetical protein [Trifolium medium]
MCSHDVGEGRDGMIEDRTGSARLSGMESFNGKSGLEGTLGTATGFVNRVLRMTGMIDLRLGQSDHATGEARP